MVEINVQAMHSADVARVCSSPGRLLILSYLSQNGTSSWSEILKFLSSELGPVNPNTLHFHLKTLIQVHWVKRSGSEDSPAYSVSKLPGEIVPLLPKIPEQALR